MKNYIRCPRCRKFSRIGKHLRAGWDCPNCHNEIIPKEERIINEFVLKSILNKNTKNK